MSKLVLTSNEVIQTILQKEMEELNEYFQLIDNCHCFPSGFDNKHREMFHILPFLPDTGNGFCLLSSQFIFTVQNDGEEAEEFLSALLKYEVQEA